MFVCVCLCIFLWNVRFRLQFQEARFVLKTEINKSFRFFSKLRCKRYIDNREKEKNKSRVMCARVCVCGRQRKKKKQFPDANLSCA